MSTRSLVFILMFPLLATAVQCLVAGTATEPSAAQASVRQGEGERQWRLPDRFYLTLSNVIEDNLDRDQRRIASYGVIAGFGLHFRKQVERRTVLQLQYEIANHSHSGSTKWDRVSHFLYTEFSPRLSRRLVLETSAELSIKGSNEDRDLANQGSLRQEVKYSLSRVWRIKTYATYRVKRYDDDSTRNTIAPHIGAVLETRFGADRSLEIGWRYEKSRPMDSNRRYIRRTYGLKYETSFGSRNRLTVEATFKPQLYARSVESGGLRVPRSDQRWNLGIEWERLLWERVLLVSKYEWERRESNDTTKEYGASRLSATFRYGL